MWDECVSAVVWFEGFRNFSAKVPGSSFDGWPFFRCIQGSGLLWFESENHSPFMLCACVPVCVVFMCVFTPVMDWEPVLQGPQKKQFLSDSITTASWAGGTTRGYGTTRSASHRFPDTSLNKEAYQFWNVHLQAWFHLSVFFFSHAILQPTSLTWYLIPHVSEPICTKIPFAGNCHCHTVPDMTLLIVYCLLKGSPLADVVTISYSSSGPH